jgi:capsular polysaccharide transport system permease protein
MIVALAHSMNGSGGDRTLSIYSVPTWADFHKSAQVQLRVIRALMIRNVMSRFGHNSLGFFWLMGEPLILTCGVMVMWSFTGAEGGHNIGVVPMALTGYSFITMWRHIIGHSIHAIRHNSDLRFHQNIKALDILVSNAVLELVGIVSAFLIAYLPLALYGVIWAIRDPLLLFSGFVLTAWFSFSFGLLITAMSELSETASRFVAPIMYITLPFTGVFFMVDWLPDRYQNLILWSPLVNCIEMIRGGLFPNYMATYYDPLYVVICCIGLTAVGIPAVHYAQEHAQH